MTKKELPIIRFNNETARLPRGKSEGTALFTVLARRRFGLNAPALKQIGLASGDGIEVLHDPNTDEWFVAPAANGIPLCKNKRGAGHFGSVILYKRLLSSLEEGKGTFLLASEPTKVAECNAWAILLSSKGKR